MFNLASDTSTSSIPSRFRQDHWARPRPLLTAVLLSLSCTLTRDDYEPTEVSSLASDAGGNSGNGAAGAPGVVCTGPNCCSVASDCDAGEVCSLGVCSPACSPLEDPSSCEVALCPGPSCPGSVPSCDDGVQNGTEAAVDCGGGCPAACSSGATCGRDGDCASGLFCAPSTHRCTDGSCQDGTLGGNEVLADCGGGECPGCPTGSPCTGPEDCESNVCTSAVCGAASCSDAALSGDESDVDCGGSAPSCPRCSDGGACRAGTDCQSGSCSGGVCASCVDDSRNGTETDTDCGGSNPDCARCADGALCNIGDDCVSGGCSAGRCVSLSCSDGVQNGTETATDCGGADADCPRCGLAATCTTDTDCGSRSCDGGRCISCADGVQNGTETATDCGGADLACSRCAPGARCQADPDCASGACEDGFCCGGSQVDCTRCALRLSPTVDCDNPTAGVDPTGVANCTIFLQCLSDNADRCPTRNTPGCSGDNQAADACPHNNYGGNAGTGVTRATQVLQNAGCQL